MLSFYRYKNPKFKTNFTHWAFNIEAFLLAMLCYAIFFFSKPSKMMDNHHRETRVTMMSLILALTR